LPPGIAKKLDLAISHVEGAPGQSSKRAKHLFKSATRILGKARRLTTKAAGGRRAKLSSQCSADLANAIGAASQAIASLG